MIYFWNLMMLYVNIGGKFVCFNFCLILVWKDESKEGEATKEENDSKPEEPDEKKEDAKDDKPEEVAKDEVSKETQFVSRRKERQVLYRPENFVVRCENYHI